MKQKAQLVCRRCGAETIHETHYAGSVLHEIRCTECGLETFSHHRPIRSFAQELRTRTTSKPARLAREVAEHPRNMWLLPARIVSKPIRVAKEIIEVIR